MKYYVVTYTDGTYVRTFDTNEQSQMFISNHKEGENMIIKEVSINIKK